MSATVAAAERALRAQWDRLRPWVGEVVSDAVPGAVPGAMPGAGSLGAEPSVLDGWTVAELVAHLGRAMEALAVCVPLPPGTTPLTLGEYVGTYSARAADIAQTTRALAVEIADDPLRHVDDSARAAFDQLSSLGPSDIVVQARRGPVRLSTMATSRVVELVVHADDLYRSVRRVPGAGPVVDPVDPDALRLVSDELLAIVVARGGWDLEVADERQWMRLAAGREPATPAALAAALRPRWTGEGIPDLGRTLPLL